MFENNWVDVLKICEEVRLEFIELVGEDENNYGVNFILFNIYFKVVNLFMLVIELDMDKVVIVVVKGIILDGN